MSRWDELFSRMRRIEAERLEAERREREAETLRRERDAWAGAALDAMWRAVMTEVTARSEELLRVTGRRIEIVRHERSAGAADGLAALRILELRLTGSVVYLYSHHAPGGEVHVHVAQWPASDASKRKHHRMISLPVCTLERVGPKHWSLMRIASDRRPRELTVEDIVYRALELLVFSLERPDPRLLTPPAAPGPLSSKTAPQFPDR